MKEVKQSRAGLIHDLETYEALPVDEAASGGLLKANKAGWKGEEH